MGARKHSRTEKRVESQRRKNQVTGLKTRDVF